MATKIKKVKRTKTAQVQNSLASALTEKPENLQLKWREKGFKDSVQIRQGFEGMMLEKIYNQNQEVMKLAKATRQGTIGQPDDPNSSEDNMGVFIGNTIINNHGSLPAQQEEEIVEEEEENDDGSGDNSGGGDSDPNDTSVDGAEEEVVETPQVTEPTKPAEPAIRDINLNITNPPSQTPPQGASNTTTTTTTTSRNGLLGAGLIAAAVLGGAGIVGALSDHNPVVIQPNRPDTVVVKPDQPVPGSQTGYKLGVRVTRPSPLKKKENDE